MNDARFEDAPLAHHPLRLRAESVEDLAILSALAQDSVGRAGDIAWMPRKRRLVLVMNRFRWENGTEDAQPQRVRSAISVESVLRVRARGLDPADSGQVCD
ncbi:MAG TPA: DUF2948 family protein, partial [Thermohalobaculum sp.]|nr:DUF2948 family protein [Thermohalobaculum sp.]